MGQRGFKDAVTNLATVRLIHGRYIEPVEPAEVTPVGVGCVKGARVRIEDKFYQSVVGFVSRTNLCFVEGSTRANVLTRSLAPEGRTPTVRNGDDIRLCAAAAIPKPEQSWLTTATAAI